MKDHLHLQAQCARRRLEYLFSQSSALPPDEIIEATRAWHLVFTRAESPSDGIFVARTNIPQPGDWDADPRIIGFDFGTVRFTDEVRIIESSALLFVWRDTREAVDASWTGMARAVEPADLMEHLVEEA